MARLAPYIAQNSVDDFGLTFSNLKYSSTVDATTDTTLTVPSSAPRFKAVMKVESNGLVYVALNETAEAPAGNTFTSTTSELINDAKSLCREVVAGDVLHFYSLLSVDISVVFYALNTTNGV